MSTAPRERKGPLFYLNRVNTPYRAILHRKNAYFYRTSNGAHVGDLFMSLIHTCELAGVNALEYLTLLQRHLDIVRETPATWMPWNYQESLTILETGTASA
jgi:transposase